VLAAQVEQDVVANVNVNFMMDLFNGAKGDLIEFRIHVIKADAKRPKDTYMFRTIDEFLVAEDGSIAGGSGIENVPEGAYRCRVTRFTPGID